MERSMSSAQLEKVVMAEAHETVIMTKQEEQQMMRSTPIINRQKIEHESMAAIQNRVIQERNARITAFLETKRAEKAKSLRQERYVQFAAIVIVSVAVFFGLLATWNMTHL